MVFLHLDNFPTFLVCWQFLPWNVTPNPHFCLDYMRLLLRFFTILHLIVLDSTNAKGISWCEILLFYEYNLKLIFLHLLGSSPRKTLKLILIFATMSVICFIYWMRMCYKLSTSHLHFIMRTSTSNFNEIRGNGK